MDQVDSDVAGAIIISAQHILGLWAAITNVETDVVVFGSDAASEGTHDLAAPVARAVYEPD
jgi:hypothetical protein